MTLKEIIEWQAGQIAELRADKTFLKERVAYLEAALAVAERQRPLTGRERSQRWRDEKRHERNENATETQRENVTPALRERESGSLVPPDGPLGVLPLRTPVPVTPLNPPEPSERERHSRVCKTDLGLDWGRFREAFPNPHRRTVWTKAEAPWAKLKPEERTASVLGAKNYAGSEDVLRGCEMAADRWLKERRWESWQEPEIVLPPVLHGNGHAATDKNTPDYSGIAEWGRRHGVSA